MKKLAGHEFGGGATWTLASQLEKNAKTMYNFNERNYTMGRRLGFTLAEVLITLAIIGVVAALTIPTLVTNYQKKSYVTKLQKNYSMLLNSFKLMFADEGVDYFSQTNYFKGLGLDNGGYGVEDLDVKALNDRYLSKYIKIIQSCSDSSLDNNCLMNSVEYKLLNGDDMGTISEFIGGIKMGYLITPDGSTIWIIPYASMIVIDVNGQSGPNVLGRDLFIFMFGDDETENSNTVFRLIPLGTQWAMCENAHSYFCPSNPDLFNENPELCGKLGSSDVTMATGEGCAERIMLEGWKMNY